MSKATSSHRWTNWIKFAVPAGVGILLCVLIYRQLGPEEKKDLFNALRYARYEWFALAIALGALSHASRAYRWKYLLQPLGKTPQFKHSFYAVMVGYLMNMVLPRAGEASRALALSRSEGIAFERTFGTIFAERVIDMFVLLGITALTFYLQFELLGEHLDTLQGGLKAKLGLLFWVGAAFGIFMVWLLFRFGRRSRFAIVRKLYLLALGFYAGLKTIFTMRNKGWFIFHTLLIWSLYIAMYWVCFFTLPETSNVSVNGVFAGFVLGSFAIVLFPGGIGAYPVAVQKALMLYGVAGAFGFALGWIMWFSQSLMIVSLGLVSLYLTPKTRTAKSR
ncbi:MAG: UPF0104 family protein [Cryomorphaceae bacterium]|nr:MAG: UPF0104 family protein [Cryomorphaceae bacterium]